MNTNDIDSSITNFDTNIDGAVGIYLNNRENALEVSQQLASSVGAYLTAGLDGKFKLVRLTADFADGTQNYTVSAEDMEEKSLQISDKIEVLGSVKLAYCKNWTVQDTGLAGGIPSNNIALYAKPWWYVLKKDDVVVSRYQQSIEPPQKDTLLVNTLHAETEATRLLNLYKTPRFIYTATYFSHMLLAELGELVKITYPRFGLDAGKIGTIISLDRDWLNGRATIGVLI